MESSFQLMIFFITLNLLLFPLKQFAGLYLFSFKDISSLLRSAIAIKKFDLF